MLIQCQPAEHFRAIKSNPNLLGNQEIEVLKILIQKINQNLTLVFIIAEHSETLGNI